MFCKLTPSYGRKVFSVILSCTGTAQTVCMTDFISILHCSTYDIDNISSRYQNVTFMAIYILGFKAFETFLLLPQYIGSQVASPLACLLHARVDNTT